MKYPVLVLLLAVAAALILPVVAAEITFSADSSEYFFPLGATATVPITVTSTYDHDIDGTIQFTTTEQLQNSGTVMYSTKNRVYSDTISPGTAQIGLDGGTSNVEKSLKVQIVYDYTDTSPVQVTMPEIVIHFVSQVPQQSGAQAPVASTSGPGTGNVPSGSSVQIVQQSVSVQQQAGRDGTLQQALSNGQQAENTNALKEQLQREAQKTQQDKASFEEALGNDPLLSSVNESLAADGFTRQSLSSNPSSGSSGSFSMEYRNAAGESVSVGGSMENGIVPSIQERSKAPVNVTAPLASNATYKAMAQQLQDKGYQRNSTALDLSLSGATVNLTFQDRQGKPAFINATTSNGNVTQISLETEKEAPFDYLPILACVVIGAVALVAAWVLYRKLRNRPLPVHLPVANENLYEEPFDHRNAARKLLAQAEVAYGDGDPAAACGFAGQALRLLLACENGVRRELTNAELVALLQSKGRDARSVDDVLSWCADVEFARGVVDEGEFSRITAFILDSIDRTQAR
ncbi:hypothetical protein [Methanoregula sp.]|uniref:hypothetical protein n=1 Tax=Methanoregula sp. TaxID=2052170 RepID=UPI002635E297|nr:hypothetical protein [Methanoregula sp.]MDD5142445.1 hypothetical protein [Methanoregula sp.]